MRPEIATVSLVIRFPVDSLCYPFSAGYDSTHRDMYLARYYDELKSIGQFKVAEFGTQDSFIFETGFLLDAVTGGDTNFTYRAEVFTDYRQIPDGYYLKPFVFNFEGNMRYREVKGSTTNSYFDLAHGFMNNEVNTYLEKLSVNSRDSVLIDASVLQAGATTKIKYLGRKLN